MDKQRFINALNDVQSGERIQSGIGTLHEKTMHAVLKKYFEPYSDNHETKIGDYVADIVGEHGIIEIQTGSFERLNKKLAAFLEYARTTVVYPVSVSNVICRIDENGEITRRKSAVKGSVLTLFDELYKISAHLKNERLRICVMLLKTEEYRKVCSRKQSRKGFMRLERVPTELVDEIYIDCPSGFAAFFPDNLTPPYTCSEYAAAMGIDQNTARLMLYTFTKADIITRCGKRGNAYLYNLPDFSS
ncbi:MAG: hypothetical protein ACI396_00495 [Acutalibacteraceae bacterium]